MHRIQISNRIFDQSLSAAAISVYAYLCSIKGNVCNGFTHVKVKQKTIAAACGIASVQTVAKAIRELTEKQIIMQSIRTVRCDRSLSTNIYVFKKLPTTDGFFFVCPEMAFSGQLVPRQLVVYLFLCKAHSTKHGYSWNSYNDMAAQIRMKRETVIATIQELCELHLIAKQLMRSRENNRVFVDNRYFIVQRETGTIKKKKPVFRPDFFTWFTGCMAAFVNLNPISVYHEWRALSRPFYLLRGSPQIESHILNPKIFSVRKRKNKVILQVYCRFILYAKKFFEKSASTFTSHCRGQKSSARCGVGGAASFFFFLVAIPEVLHENKNYELTISHEYARMEGIKCNKI